MEEKLHMNIETVVDDAIKKRLGDINRLPDAARAKIHRVYHTFYDAYLKIADLKKFAQSPESMDAAAGFDPDIIEYMQHFFSDYQTLYREFKFINQHAKALIQIDQTKNPGAFELQLNAVISGKNEFTEESVMEEILK